MSMDSQQVTQGDDNANKDSEGGGLAYLIPDPPCNMSLPGTQICATDSNAHSVAGPNPRALTLPFFHIFQANSSCCYRWHLSIHSHYSHQPASNMGKYYCEYVSTLRGEEC